MGALNPFDWTAEPFLMLYVGFATGVLLLLWVGCTRIGTPAAPDAAENLGPLHLADLSGGADRAASTALVGLIEAGAAVPDRGQRLIRFHPSAPVPTVLQPFRHVAGGEATLSGFQAEFSPYWQRVHDELARCNLVPGTGQVARFRRWGAVLLAAPLLLGAIKLVVGLSRDRPVGILGLLLGLTGLLACCCSCRARTATRPEPRRS